MKLSTVAPLGLLLFAAPAFADTALYDLDAKNAKEIANALRSAVDAQCVTGPSQNPVTNASMCRVELLSTGQLLVEAPPSSQAQVATVLKAIAARGASATPRVTLQYWVIYGAPGKPDSVDASLKPLSAVLQQLERVHGELGFSMQDATSLTTQSGASGSVHGGSLDIDQTLRATGEALDLIAHVQFARKPVVQGLNVNVTIKRGEFVVLAERTAGEPGKDETDKPASEKPGILFFVVHWPQGQ